MFSGIVTALEKPTKIERKKDSIILSFPIPKGWDITSGESINIDGICSTVTNVTKDSFSVFYMAETIRKTHLTFLSDTHRFNLERSLRLNDLVGGHLVSGHIDTVAILKKIKSEGEARVLTFTLAKDTMRYVIYKGSIAVNGVSLTVMEVSKTSFVVSLIPYTLNHTNLEQLVIGDTVAIELDLIAKYLEKLVAKN